MKSFNVMFLTELSGVAKSGCKLSAVSAAATQSRLLEPPLLSSQQMVCNTSI
jgi:hypothetical protein